MKHQHSIKSQLANNAVAIVSLLIAISTLLYSTWRSETTERNFNVRSAAFEVLQNLGQLQVIVNYLHYEPDHPMGNTLLGWGRIALIGDLAELLPPPIPSHAHSLVEKWGENWNKLKDSEELTQEISQSIDDTRASIVKVLKELH